MAAVAFKSQGLNDTYAREQELSFKADARANKLAGLWAAELKGLEEAAAEDFAMGVVDLGVGAKGQDQVVARLHMALDALKVGPDEIWGKLEELRDEAWAQVRAPVNPA